MEKETRLMFFYGTMKNGKVEVMGYEHDKEHREDSSVGRQSR